MTFTALWRRWRNDAGQSSIALFGLFGSGNTGNDATLEAILGTLRRLCPEARVLCICGNPDTLPRSSRLRTSQIYPEFSGNRVVGKLALFLNAYCELKGSKALIIPGTGALDDFGTSWSGLPLALFAWCLAARLRGAQVAFVCIGAGPIRHPRSRWLLKAAARMARYRSYRDRFSKDFLKSLGVDTAMDPVYPDLAFALPVPPDQKQYVDRRDPLVVGLGMMTYQGWDNEPEAGAPRYADYLQKIAVFALWLVDHGHSIRLLSGDRTDERSINDLQHIIKERRPALATHQLAASPCPSLRALMGEIAETDIVVATRFHNLVCALKMGRPVISIGYAAKNDALMAEVGLARFAQSVEAFDVDLLIRHFNELTSEVIHWRRLLSEVQPRYSARLLQQEQELAVSLHQWQDGSNP